MINKIQNDQYEELNISSISDLISSEETKENCEILSRSLKKSGTSLLGHFIFTNSKHNMDSPKQKEEALKNAYAGEPVDPDKIIRVVVASLAILNSKIQFFNILINAYPPIICLNQISTVKHPPIHSPLMCAIDNAEIDLVKAVLENKHFIEHECDFWSSHKQHLETCLDFATKSYASTMDIKEQAIIRLLHSTVNISLPLHKSIRENNLAAIKEIFKSSVYQNLERDYKTEHVELVSNCIRFAEDNCRSSKKEEIVEILKTRII